MAEKEYIEREAVLRHIFDQIEEHGDPDPIDSPVARGSLMGLKYAHSIVSVSPAADVVEVRHGRWIKRGNEKKCSVCGFIYYSNNDDWNGCPNCLTKMDGGKTE